MLKSIIKYLLYLCGFVSLVMLLPGTVLLDVNPKAFLYPLPKELVGNLKPNERLTPTTKLFENELFGPESIAAFNGQLVTGSHDGYLYQIEGNNMKRLIKLVEESCVTHSYNTTKCGRPLGMRFDSQGILYVVEPYVGVFTVKNIFTNNPKVNLVLDIEQTSALGEPSKFLDDLAIDEGAGLNGGDVLYISDMSTKFNCQQFVLIVAGSDMGRMIKYDINAKTVESIVENLLIPNGVEISDDKTAILFNEFMARQVSKHYIKGPKEGKTEVLVKHLPGEPDNIRRSAAKEETYWVALLSARTASKPNEMDYYLRKPLLRKLICRLLYFIGSTVERIGRIFKNSLITEYGIDVKDGIIIKKMFWNDVANENGIIIEVDINGNIVDSLQSSDNSFTRLSEVREIRVNDKESVLYIGSYINGYLGQLTLKR